jgi:transposase InsO family protein
MKGASHPLQEKREAIRFAAERGISQRRACSLLEIGRSTLRYQAQERDDTDLIERIRAVHLKGPRFGIRRVDGQFQRERRKQEKKGLPPAAPVNRKRLQRVMRENGLLIRTTCRKKTIRTGRPIPCKAEYPNHVWTLDFQDDALIGGRKVKILNILDEFTREWLEVVVGFTTSAALVMRTLLPLFARLGGPTYLRSDNGGEFIAGELQSLLREAGVASYFIDPGSPWQNGFIESFHSHLRDELLNREAFASLAEARLRLASHRLWYNQERIHSSLGYLTPEEFHQQWKEKGESGAASPPQTT